MSGLKFDNSFPAVIPAKTHGIIDYIHVGANFLAAALFSRSNKRASVAAFALGANVLANALMTDYPLGVFRLYSFKVHGALDYGVALTSAAMPKILGIEDEPEAIFFNLQGAGESIIAALSDYGDTSGSQRSQRQHRKQPQRAA
jgi:hypothetical protein